MNFKEFLYIYSIGAVGYLFVEIMWRGFTHISMGVVGGICFTIMYLLEKMFEDKNIVLRAALSAVCVTGIELVSGLVLNKLLNMNVWDYSALKYNFLGQISITYSIFWFFLCIPCHILCRILRHRVFDVLSQSSRH